MIVLDDLNDWVGVLGGHPQAKTPNIDELASRGMLFTNAQTVATACLPSRTAMLTGVSPFNSGIYDQSGDWRDVSVLREIPTMPRYFRESGYASIGAGKIFHAHTFSESGFPGQQDLTAWNRFYPSFERQLADEVEPPGAPMNGNPLVVNAVEGSDMSVDWLHTGFDWSAVVVEDFAMGDGQVAGWIEQQLAAAESPTFIAAGIYRPHLPWYVPPEYFERHPLDSIELPETRPDDLDDVPSAAPFQGGRRGDLDPTDQHEWVLENDLWPAAVQGYLASVSFADAMVGKIVSALDRSPNAANTIVVLVSDHGYHLGEKQRWRKMTLWEEATRVPLIVVAPGVTTAGSKSGEAVSLLDIYPTLIELAGLPRPAHLDGQSLVGLLSDPDESRDLPAITVWGFGNVSVRDEQFRYIRYQDGSEELYDVTSDPNAWINLAADPNSENVRKRLNDYIPKEQAADAFAEGNSARTR